ncbi:Vps52 [Phytophthora cactorum]|nr:Vps52 [Phytophthora cactorum]
MNEVQQNTLLPMKYLVTFLADNAPEVEEEFREVYAEAMSKTLVNVFKSYHTGLMKFHEEVAARTDVIVVDEQSLKGIFSYRVNLSKRNDTFSVTEREKILETASAPPLILHVAQQEGNTPSAKDKCVFLINNYDLVLTHFEERRVTSEETSKFEELLAAQREKFVEEELMTYYAKLIQFVRQHEQATLGKGATSTAGSSQQVDTEQIEKIVREFAATWKAGIEKMNGNVMTYFSNFRNGMEILKQVLTQLLLYYTRFVEIVKRSYQRPPPFNSEIVTTQEILYEIKKYSRSF